MSRLSLRKTLPLLRERFVPAPSPRLDRGRARFSPGLEVMEGRALLSTLHVGSSQGDYSTIQGAVLAANPGDSIQVAPGTYREQVVIDKNSRGVTLDNLTLKGSGQSSIIQLPSTAPPSPSTVIVEIKMARNVTIDGFTVQGPGNAPSDSIGYGIEVDGGGSATISNDHITQIRDNPRSGTPNGVAILVGGQTSGSPGMATITRNTIDDYQKGGIVVDGDGSSAEIDHNTVTGVGPTDVNGQNGIQISDGATAEVTHNTISANIYTPQIYAASGILLSQSGAVTIDQNTLANNDVGIYSIATDGPVIDQNQVTNSTFDGIQLFMTTGATVSHNSTDHNGYGDRTGNTTGDGGIALYNSTNNTVSQNESSNNQGDGIFVDSTSSNNSFDQNKLSNNSNYDAEDQSRGGGTAGTANTWTKNKGKTSSPPGLVR